MKSNAVATARYNRYVTVEFDSGIDAKEFFYGLCQQMGYPTPWKGKGYMPSGTGLLWALRQLSPKHINELTRQRRR